MRNNVLMESAFRWLKIYNTDLYKISAELVHCFSSSRSLFFELNSVISSISKGENGTLNNGLASIGDCKNCLSDLGVLLQFEDTVTQRLSHIVEANKLVLEYINFHKLNVRSQGKQAVFTIVKQTAQLHLAQLLQIKEEYVDVGEALNTSFGDLENKLNLIGNKLSGDRVHTHTVSEINGLCEKMKVYRKCHPAVPVSALNRQIEVQQQFVDRLEPVVLDNSEDVNLFFDRFYQMYTVECERIVFSKVFKRRLVLPGRSSINGTEAGSVDLF